MLEYCDVENLSDKELSDALYDWSCAMAHGFNGTPTQVIFHGLGWTLGITSCKESIWRSLHLKTTAKQEELSCEF